jgi:hypothetical protein
MAEAFIHDIITRVVEQPPPPLVVVLLHNYYVMTGVMLNCISV